MNKINIITLICIVFFPIQAQDVHIDKQWAWVYRKAFGFQELTQSSEKKELLFAKKDIPSFSQLIFSWNAIRPTSGYFSFFVQARDARTKRWGKWHHMIDWGARIQKSYLTQSDGHTQYRHVRLEVERNKPTDAFRIKVGAKNGADLSLLKSVTVSLADYKKFKPESFDCAGLPSVHVRMVPKIAQFALDHPDAHRICSPTSCSMLTSFILGEQIDPVQFADRVFDQGLDIFGSWPFNVAHTFEHCVDKAYIFTRRLNSFAELYRQLKRGIPIVVSVRGELDGAPKVYENGHLLVVVGWDAKTRSVICHDPAHESPDDTLKQYSIKSFLPAWERSHRLVYWTEPLREA